MKRFYTIADPVNYDQTNLECYKDFYSAVADLRRCYTDDYLIVAWREGDTEDIFMGYFDVNGNEVKI